MGFASMALGLGDILPGVGMRKIADQSTCSAACELGFGLGLGLRSGAGSQEGLVCVTERDRAPGSTPALL